MFCFVGMVLFFATARLVAYSARNITAFPMHTLANMPILSACFVFTFRLTLAGMLVHCVIAALASPVSVRVCRHLLV